MKRGLMPLAIAMPGVTVFAGGQSSLPSPAPQALVARVDTAAAVHPNPGRRPFQRLSRVEYARAVMLEGLGAKNNHKCVSC